MNKAAILTMLAFAVTACGAIAQAPKVSLDAQKLPISEAAKQVSDGCGLEIIVDTGVKGTVNGHLIEMDLEQVLNTITQSNNLNWQKLYAKPGSDGRIPLDAVKAQMAALKALQDTSLVVYDPVTKKRTVFVRAEAETSGQVVDTVKLGLKECYFIYSTLPTQESASKDKSKKSALDEFAELRKQRFESFMKMTPEEQKAAAEQDMNFMVQLPPAVQAQMVGGMVDAFAKMDPGLRDQFGHSMRDAMRSHRDQQHE